MRAWVLAVALSVALVATPVWAQRGGGGGGHGGGGFGGGHGVSGGGHAGGVSAARGYAGGGVARSGYSGYRGTGSYSGGPVFSQSPRGAYSNGYGWRGNNWGWRGNGWRGYPYRYPGYWGYRGYPWWGYGYAGWYPYWGWGGGYGWYDSGYDYGDDYPDNSYNNYYAPPTYPSDVYLGAPNGGYAQGNDSYAANDATQSQIQQLQGQVSQLQAQQSNRAPSPKFEEIHSDTVLVYKDGRKQEIQNYAIVGRTLWIMNENKATKIPLSDLNLAATKRDNEDRGIDFNVPGTQR